MPNHVTNVIEIQEAGILLKTRGQHVVRVLGALKEVPLPTSPPAKEHLKSRTDASVYEQYHSGALAGPQDDPEVQPYHPRVPSLFITRDGESIFLERDWS